MQQEFRDQLIKLYEIEDLEQSEQDELLGEIGGVVFQAALIRVTPTLSEDAQAQVEKLMDSNASPDEMFALIRSVAPNFDQIIAEEAVAFKGQVDEILKGE